MQNRVAIFIDAGNYHYALKKHGWKIDYIKFVEYFRRDYNLVQIHYYEGYPTYKMHCIFTKKPNRAAFDEQKKRKMSFFKLLKSQGIIVRTKPVVCIYDVINNQYKIKCNFDVELTIDALDTLNEYDEVFLCTGDGDFAKLISYLKGKHKIVNVVSMKDRYSSLLKEARPHNVLYLNKLKPEIMLTEIKKAQP